MLKFLNDETKTITIVKRIIGTRSVFAFTTFLDPNKTAITEVSIKLITIRKIGAFGKYTTLRVAENPLIIIEEISIKYII